MGLSGAALGAHAVAKAAGADVPPLSLAVDVMGVVPVIGTVGRTGELAASLFTREAVGNGVSPGAGDRWRTRTPAARSTLRSAGRSGPCRPGADPGLAARRRTECPAALRQGPPAAAASPGGGSDRRTDHSGRGPLGGRLRAVAGSRPAQCPVRGAGRGGRSRRAGRPGRRPRAGRVERDRPGDIGNRPVRDRAAVTPAGAPVRARESQQAAGESGKSMS